MTQKLFENDSYIKEFSATVISCENTEGKFLVTLDKTAFFPEGGGQSSDTGFLGEAQVISVREADGIVYHKITAPISGEVLGRINFKERFDKMQNHTAEHILLGFIHKLYGLDNVGFHLGNDQVVFDISEPLTPEQLKTAEDMANAAVWQNIPVEVIFPEAEELSSLGYRSKLELTENVRLVKIGDVDLCACCAPHVSYTGEVGMIKILDVMRHRGGMRIWLAAGERALADYRMNKENIAAVSWALSVPKEETAEALKRYMKEADAIRSELKSARRALAEAKAQAIEKTEGNLVVHLPDMGADELRAFVNCALPKVSGMLVALSGGEGDYKYIIASEKVNITEKIKDINTSLSGRGGGKPNAAQGSFAANLSEIKKYFES